MLHPRKQPAAAGRERYKPAWEKESDMEQHIPSKRSKGAASSNRVKEILDWYKGENAGTLTSLARMLNHGTLAGTGKMVILPVDQGFEHGPARSFAPNAEGYHPHYHFQLAVDAGCNAYAAPLGFLEAGAAEFAGQIPLILKLNNSDSLFSDKDPCPAVTGSVQDALRLGCCAIGYTIYPGSAHRNAMYEDLRELTLEAKEAGLAVVVWAYPRGGGLSKEGETAIDVAAYAAQITAQLGAHVIKVKVPTDHIEQDEARKVYEKEKIPISTLADRIRHVVQSAFNGRRIVIFSGGAAKGTEEVLAEIQGIRDGGGFGSIIGRNSFQRPKADALSLLSSVMDIYLK
jgi:class I fructose-bisphosphate aldolase